LLLEEVWNDQVQKDHSLAKVNVEFSNESKLTQEAFLELLVNSIFYFLAYLFGLTYLPEKNQKCAFEMVDILT